MMANVTLKRLVELTMAENKRYLEFNFEDKSKGPLKTGKTKCKECNLWLHKSLLVDEVCVDCRDGVK
jgi:hypothetical protein